MPKVVGIIILLVFLLIFLPAIIVLYSNYEREAQKKDIENILDSDLKSGTKIKVFSHTEEKIMELDIEQYLVGVVAAEMPAAFQLEALKAQAIAARTYALRKMNLHRAKGNENHPGADICTDFSHNQAWISTEEMKAKWGPNFSYYHNKIKEAVLLTKDQVILFNGQLIDPAYHADCGGVRTENSEDVWQSKVSYLQSVECLPREDKSKSKETISLTLNKVDLALGTNLEAVPVAKLKEEKEFIKTTSKTRTGRVKEIKIGDKKLQGTEVRKALNLRSTNFKADLKGDKVNFTTIGNGHGVGLCQVGVNEWAKKGLKYNEILLHYYQGVKIGRLSKN